MSDDVGWLSDDGSNRPTAVSVDFPTFVVVLSEVSDIYLYNIYFSIYD